MKIIKKMAFGHNFQPVSVVRKVFYAFLYYENKPLLIGLLFIAALALIALFAPAFTPYAFD
ncbi:MAG: hypothetical protein AAB221_02775, partial [Bacteroidota bacterium]